jgi:RNA polymerase sigma factor (TIGR02999 family)
VNQKSGPAEITALLKRWTGGDRDALARVLPLVYAELRRIAARQLSSEDAAHSIDPTDLVHALYLELVEQRRATWLNRTQFFAVVAQMMRRILVDHARARLAAKRGGTTVTISLTSLVSDPAAGETPVSDVLSIDRALERLAARDSEHARIVELRFFAGLSIEETADVLERSPATVKRAWRVAKAWLFRELRLRPSGTDAD